MFPLIIKGSSIRSFKLEPLVVGFPRYGAKRIRTADPLNAIEVLYQLSYNPVQCVFYDAVITRFRQV